MDYYMYGAVLFAMVSGTILHQYRPPLIGRTGTITEAITSPCMLHLYLNWSRRVQNGFESVGKIALCLK